MVWRCSAISTCTPGYSESRSRWRSPIGLDGLPSESSLATALPLLPSSTTGATGLAPLGAARTPAAGSETIGVAVPLPVDDRVFLRVVCVDLPVEEVGVERLQLLRVVPDGPEMHHRLSHAVSFARRPRASAQLLCTLTP